MKTISELLKKARDRIASPGSWTQGAEARDRHQTSVSAFSESAVCWCAIGALLVECEGSGKHWEAMLHYLEVSIGRSVAAFNDNRRTTQAQVLFVFERAIQAARKDEE